MAFPGTLAQKRLINDAIVAFGAEQLRRGNALWLVDLAYATMAEKRNALVTYLQSTRTSLVTSQGTLPTSRAAQDADITGQIADLDTILGGL